MFRNCIVICCVPAVLGIIVTDPPPTGTEYKYSYNIQDPTTGDTKSQHEVKHGDTVSGAYSVVDPDGTKRTVEYSADPKSGFKAVVKQEPIATEHTPQKIEHYTHNDVYANHRYEPTYAKTIDRPLSRGIQNQVPYPYHSETQYAPVIYFTPANEIALDKTEFSRGQYIMPAYNH